MSVWLSVWSEVQIVCIWSSWCNCHPKTPSSLASFKFRLVLPLWYQFTHVVPENRLLNGCSSSSSSRGGAYLHTTVYGHYTDVCLTPTYELEDFVNAEPASITENIKVPSTSVSTIIKSWIAFHKLAKHTHTPFNGPLSGTTGCACTRRRIHPLTPVWSSNILYLLPVSTTIYSILFVQFTCLTVLFHNLCPGPVCSTSWSGALYFVFHKFLHPYLFEHMPIAHT